MGYEVSEELEYADLYIINTCAVTAEAEKKSRQTVARVRKFNKSAKIMVMGCASEKSPEDFYKKDGVSYVTGTKAKERILSDLSRQGINVYTDNEYIEGFLPIKTDRTRAYIKVEDGCDNFCSYCIIPYLRGRVRSAKIENVVKEIEYVKPLEAVITGINLSAYNDSYGGLTRLIDNLQGVDCRIRLGSLEVNVITDEFLSALKGLKNFAEHFHLSLQSGSDNVLKSMNRHYDVANYLKKCDLIRKYFPSAGITTDIIVGYSTETEEDFSLSMKTAQRAQFSDVHCFPYSRREGTVGAKLKEIPSETKSARMEKMLALKAELKKNFILKNLGREEYFVPEEQVGEYTVGYTGNYIRCYVLGKTDDKILKVKLIKEYDDGVIAVLI